MLVFLIIGGVGIALLVVSLLLGEVLDGLFEGIGGDLFSGAALAGFLGVFGFAGALTLSLTDSVGLAILFGLLSGGVVGALTGWATLKLREGGDEANVRTGDLVGSKASVVTAIPDGGYGEITMVASGHITRLNARSAGPVPSGASVTITGVLSATSVMVEADLPANPYPYPQHP
ncbi:hypothetical protein EXU48_02545 [Occultella glacieicola]|uniref:NfeD-like C-terminal domain-containing protein n=1 Tax=Occultella glacieicola TaxID=2518684 RepID=A0ABY2E9A2_9MICO|nr:hypothetical protein [Occultella glacieicola]TDE99078.1 hypothetical protein EXU48_02545 [Occultella glacieicola]